MKLKHLITSARVQGAALALAGLMAGSLAASAQSKYTKAEQAVAAQGVIDRFIGDDTSLRVTVAIDLDKDASGKDKFRYDYNGGTLTVHGSSGVAACRGFYDFVKSNGAGISSWSSKRFQMPQTIEHTSKEFTSPYRDHQYFNVVTYGYSMPYWDEDRWMKELDWMALHGIDMPLMLLASESIYRDVFSEKGVTEQELNEWEVGPAHLPWMRMGNLCGNSFDGPLGDNWHMRQKQIAKAVLTRMGELGMKPVVPAFGGFVPPAYAQRLGSDKYQPTGWGWIPGNFKNNRITPAIPEFKEIGQSFVEKWDAEFESYYGNFEYYLSDSFNEMDVPTNLTELASYGEQIFKSIQEGSGNDKAVWVTQGWTFIFDAGRWKKISGDTAAQYRALRSKVPAHQFMSLYMSPEYEHADWTTYSNFCGDDWNYTMLPNMGGETFWTGNLNNYAQNYPKRMANGTAYSNCTGWGMTMEGIEYNELLYELISDMGWTNPTQGPGVQEWMEKYGATRYGSSVYGDEFKALHTTLRNTVYNSYVDNAHFGWQGYCKGSSYYTAGNINTTSDAFFQGIEAFFSPENIQKLKNGGPLSEPLRNDLIEFAAFYAAARIEKVCTRITTLNNQGKKAEAKALIAELNKLMYEMDYVLSAHPIYDLSKWEQKAKDMAKTDPTEEEHYVKNARRIVSTWYGDHQYQEPVCDYAGRIWSGLIRDYYRPRLIGELTALVDGTSVNLRNIERAFVPNGTNNNPAPALNSPKHVVNDELVDVSALDPNTADDVLLDLVKSLVDEATEAGQFTVEKNLVEPSRDGESHWYFINSNNPTYLDRALTVTNAQAAKGDIRANVNTGADAQIWRFVANGDDTYRIENRDGQVFSWDNGAAKTFMANINSDVKLELDVDNHRYAILPQAMNQALHFNNNNGTTQAYGYKNNDHDYYAGSTWTLAKADGNVLLVENSDRSRICNRINGFSASVWGDESLYGSIGQPNSADVIAKLHNDFVAGDPLETYTQYIARYDNAVAENFTVPSDAQARKLFDLILSAFQLKPNSNPTGKEALRAALLTAQTALANGATGDAAKTQIAPLETAIKAFIENVVNFPYVSAAPQNGKFVEGSTVITLKCNSSRGGYVTTTTREGENFKLTNATKPTTSAGYWVVSGDDTNGYSFYNVEAGATKVLGFSDPGGNTGGNARAKLYDAASVPSGVTYKFFYRTNSNGVPVFYTGTNTAWNDRDGYLSYWTSNDAFGTDKGSTFTIEVVADADLGETATGGGEVTPTDVTTATITAVFPNDVRRQLYSDGTSIAAGNEVPAGATKDFEVESYDTTTGNIVLKVNNKYLHWLCDESRKSETSGLNAEFDEALNTLVLEPANFEGGLHTTASWGKTAADVADLYQIKGLGSNKTDNYYFTLRQNDNHFISASAGERWFDTNWDGNGCRTSFFEVVITEPEEPALPYAFPLNFDYDKDVTRDGRTLSSVKITPDGEAEQSFNVEPGKIYRNLTETAVFTCAPGQTIKAAVGYTNNAWMHAYFYIDENHDGQLSIPTSLTDNTSELKAYSFWSGDINQENSGQNSAGTPLTQGARNTVDMPEFTAPEEEGEYKVRFKVDWNCVDPGGQFGSAYTKNFIDANGGYIVDAVLKVVAPAVDAAKAEYLAAMQAAEDLIAENGENPELDDILLQLLTDVTGISMDIDDKEEAGTITAADYHAAKRDIEAAIETAQAAIQDVEHPVAFGRTLPLVSGIYQIQNAPSVENRGYLVDYKEYTAGPSLADCKYPNCGNLHPSATDGDETCSYWYVHEKNGKYYIVSLSSLLSGEELHFLDPGATKGSLTAYSQTPVALEVTEHATRTYSLDGRTLHYMLIADAETPTLYISGACGTRSSQGAVKTDDTLTDGGVPWQFIWTGLSSTDATVEALRQEAVRVIEQNATIERVVIYIDNAQEGKATLGDVEIIRDIILEK